jgi:hypothetical protein
MCGAQCSINGKSLANAIIICHCGLCRPVNQQLSRHEAPERAVPREYAVFNEWSPRVQPEEAAKYLKDYLETGRWRRKRREPLMKKHHEHKEEELESKQLEIGSVTAEKHPLPEANQPVPVRVRTSLIALYEIMKRVRFRTHPQFGGDQSARIEANTIRIGQCIDNFENLSAPKQRTAAKAIELWLKTIPLPNESKFEFMDGDRRPRNPHDMVAENPLVVRARLKLKTDLESWRTAVARGDTPLISRKRARTEPTNTCPKCKKKYVKQHKTCAKKRKWKLY